MITNITSIVQWLRTNNQPQKLAFLLAFVCSAVLCHKAAMADENKASWQFVKNEGNVDISIQNTQSGYYRIKARMIVSGKPSELINILDNVDHACDWIDSCKKVSIIDTPDNNTRIVHTFFKAPWPVKDRDMVTFSQIAWSSNGDLTINVEDYSDKIGPSESYVRMQNVTGVWHAIKLADGQVEISYQGYGEPAGNLPVWLANRISVSSTLATFSSLKKQFERIHKH